MLDGWKCVALKKSKSLSFLSKKKFLKSDGLKSNHKNMMKSNDRTPSHHGSENRGTCFFWWFLEKNSLVAYN